jgi:hypothetical protein
LSIFNGKNGKKLLNRSLYVKILVFLGLIGVSVIVLKPIQAAISGAVVNIRSEFIEKIEISTGLEVNYSSIRPAFLGSFDIRNLKISREKDEFLSISRARINYSIPELLFGNKNAFHTIQIERPSLNLDLDKNIDWFSGEFFASLHTSVDDNRELFDELLKFLPEKADYRIRNCLLNITSSEGTLQITDMNFDIRGNGNGLYFDSKFTAEIKYENMFNNTLFIKTGAEIFGEVSSNPQEGKAQVRIASLACSMRDNVKPKTSFFRPAVNSSPKLIFIMSPVTFGLKFKDRILFLESPGENALSGYFASIDTQFMEVQVFAGLENFIAGSYITFSDDYKKYSHLLNMPVSGGFSLKRVNNGVEYDINLQGALTSLYSPQNDSFLIDMTGNERHLTINNLALAMSETTAKAGLFQGAFNFSGDMVFSPFKPGGTFSVSQFSFTGKESVSAIFNISSWDNDIRISSAEFKISDLVFNSMDIYLYPDEKETGINIYGLCEDESSIYLDAVFSKSPAELEASLTLDSFSVYNLSEIFRPFAEYLDFPDFSRGFLQENMLDAEIFITTDFSHLVYNAPNIVIKNDDTLGIISVSGTDRQFTLSEGLFLLDEEELLLNVNLNFSNPMDFNFALNSNYKEMSWNIEGQILDRTTLIIRDPNGFHVYGNLSNTGAMSGYIEGVDYPFLLNKNPVYLNFYSALRYNSADFWTFDVDYFEIRDLFSVIESPNIHFSGIIDQDGASFRDIILNDSAGILVGTAEFSWDIDFSYVQTIINMTDGREAGEFYFLEGIYNDNQLTVTASVSDMHISRFLKGSGEITTTGDAFVTWNSIDDFNAKISISSFNAKAQGSDLQAAVGIEITNDEININNLALDFAGIKTFFPFIELNTNEGVFNTSADINGNVSDRKLEGKLELNVSFNQTDSWLNIREALNKFDGTIKFENIQYGNLTQESFEFVFSGRERAISISGGIRDMLRLEMDSEGNFFAGLSAPMPIRGSLAGVFKDGYLDAHCNDFYIDITTLFALGNTARNQFNIAGGYITGKIDIRGPVLNPEFFGTGRGSSFRLQVPNYIKEDIRPVPFDIIAEGYEMTFSNVVTICGSGGGITDGWFRYEYWMPRNIGLDISINRETPIPYGFNITGFLADGDASGNINILVDVDNKFTEIEGDLFMNNSEMGLNMDDVLLHSEMEPFAGLIYHSAVNLTITTGSMVEFFWPNTNNPILRVNPEMGNVFKISVDTLAGQYTMNSDIKIRSGELYYFERNFYIRQGSLIFRENETRFEPRISARAEIRDRSDTGPVRIFMIIENEPLFSFIPRFEATPSLTQLELYTILGQNLNNIQGIDNSDMAQRFLLASTTDLFTQFLASSDVFAEFVSLRQFERQLRNFLNLDMLNVRTRLLQNVVVTGAAGAGQPAVDRNNRVGNYFDNTTVFIGKYVGQDMFVQGALTIRYDENSLEYGGLRLEPDIGIELQSPFVNIRWDFFPYHPENWWVNDHSITLSWSKSF